MKNVTCRSALGLLAATGGATSSQPAAQPQATSGNASGSASVASASKTARTDHSGVATDGYTLRSPDYQPATRTEPSGLPCPQLAAANENSVEGPYQSIAFFGAAMNTCVP